MEKYKSCKVPCKECPFRKDSVAGWLANYTPQDLHTLVMSEQPFPCHMTHEKDLEFNEAEEYPLCKGALAYMKKNAKSPRNQELNALVKAVEPEVTENILGFVEFFKHHDV
jgi:hypothetical protein